MIKLLFIIGIFFSFTPSLFAEREDINLAVEISNNLDFSTEILLEHPREIRRKALNLLLLIEVMPSLDDLDTKEGKRNLNFKYSVNLTLIDNGYAEDTIPFFTKMFYQGYNEKAFDKKMGYEWFSEDNSFKIGGFEKMTKGKPLFIYMAEEIKKELNKHPEKYGYTKKMIEFKEKWLHFNYEEITPSERKIINGYCKRKVWTFDDMSCEILKYGLLKCSWHDIKHRKHHLTCLDKEEK